MYSGINYLANELYSTFQDHKPLFSLTLGLAVGYGLGKLGGRSIDWIYQRIGTTAKTDTLSRETISQSEMNNQQIQKNDLPRRFPPIGLSDTVRIQNHQIQSTRPQKDLFSNQEILEVHQILQRTPIAEHDITSERIEEKTSSSFFFTSIR